ncbi:MAG: arylsulfatase A-like enzyme [Paraglaciecola sp.]|jgi:arylsulfatase A-like enzyme
MYLPKTTVLKALFISLFFAFIAPSQAEKLNQLNILLITADDMGFDDRSAQNHPAIKTPSLDNLAKQSLQFTDFNVSPVCATTRAALLTGRDFYKTGVSGVHGGRDYLHLSETILPQVLQANNYRTGTWGKWHLGKTKGYLPEDRGFDEAYYAELYRHKNSEGFFNAKAVKHDKWVSEVVTDYAIDFMSQPSEKPFFAYVSFLAPHEPWLAPQKYVQPLIKKGLRPAIANLYGMVEEMDFNIGRLLAFLEENNLAKNTLVIFLSDNGPWWDSSNFGAMTQKEWHERNPSKMNGNKGQSWQNGIRSPLFIRWSSHWEAQTVNRYSDVKDIFPTLIETIGITLPADHKKIDGHSLLPLLSASKDYLNPRETYIGSHDVISRKPLFNQWTPIDANARNEMHYEDQLIGLRTEQYKLLLNPSVDRQGYPTSEDSYALFDMQSDPLEQNNIVSEKVKIANEMKKMLQHKFIQLRDSPESFRPPVFIVDADSDVSVINGFGPSNTGGNTTSKAHVLSNLKVKGDFANFAIKVTYKAEFDVYIKQSNTSHADSAGMVVMLSANKQEIFHELSEDPIQKIGSLTLDEHDTSFTFEVVGNHSYKPWTQISALRHFFLVPKGKNVDLANIAIPQ